MIYKDFLHGDKRISLLGFGGMRLPLDGANSADIDYALGEKMVDYAYAHGVNYYDTAWMYHDGMSQNFLGIALSKYPRQSYYLANKLPLWDLKERKDMEHIFDVQLKKCKTDYFDFYLLHNIAQGTAKIAKQVKALEFVKELKAQGKVRHIGFSFHGSPELLEEFLQENEGFEFVQIQLNYLDWVLQRAYKTYEICEKYNLQVIVMEPIRGGMLANPPAKAADVLTVNGYTPAEQALRYAASHDSVLCVLSGMSTIEQVVQNTALFAKDIACTEADASMFQRAREAIFESGALPCTGCQYCIASCPQGIAINMIFAIYNDEKFDPNTFRTQTSYFTTLPKNERATQCIECGACTTHCPQGIDIPTELKRVHAEIAGLKENPSNAVDEKV